MGLFEHSPQPGAPFLLASIMSLWAFLHCFELPAEADMYSSSLKMAGRRRGEEDAQGLLLYSAEELEEDTDDGSSTASSAL